MLKWFYLLSIPLIHIFTLVCMQTNQIWDGKYYHQNSLPQQQAALKLLKTINIEEYSHILDIGCGSGTITSQIAHRAPKSKIVGIDASSSMIQEAEKNYSHINNLSFKIMNASEMKFDDKKFNLMVSFSCLHWIKEQEKVWRLMTDNLMSGGSILISMAAKMNGGIRKRVLADMIQQSPWNEYFKNANLTELNYAKTQDDVEKMINSAGLQIEFVKTEEVCRSFESEEKLKSFILAWIGALPIMDGKSDEVKNKAAHDYVEHYKKYSPVKANGSIDYISHLLFAKANKK